MPCMLLTAGLKIITLEIRHKMIINSAGQAFKHSDTLPLTFPKLPPATKMRINENSINRLDI
ncbi:MAG: hypothetical protein WCG23_06835 [bacterium]